MCERECVIRMQTPKNVGIFSHDKTKKGQQNSGEKFGQKIGSLFSKNCYKNILQIFHILFTQSESIVRNISLYQHSGLRVEYTAHNRKDRGSISM